MPSGDSIGGHCNMFFGYNDAKNALMTLNSWGTGWGMPFGKFSGGAGWLPYGYVTQGIATDNWVIANESQITPTPTAPIPTPTPTPVPNPIPDGTAPAVAITSDGTKHFFACGSDAQLYHRYSRERLGISRRHTKFSTNSSRSRHRGVYLRSWRKQSVRVV